MDIRYERSKISTKRSFLINNQVNLRIYKMEVPIYLMTESLVLPIVNKVKEQYLVLWLSVLVVLFHVRIK